MSLPDSASAFAQLGLSPELVRAVAERGYVEPTAIQRQAIPVILAGKDVMGGAQTGTGKTAAFTLPILERLAPHANTSFSPARHPVRALILAPTRELALQVEESVRGYGKHSPLRSTAVFGGVDIDPQLEALKRGVEVVVATPGRLLDHVQQKSVNLSTVQMLVLDEADRMLDMGFMPDIRRILALLPTARQNLLFSATFPPEVKKLADTILRDPVSIQVDRRNSTAEGVEQSVCAVAEKDKRAVLVRLLRARPNDQVLVFVNTKQGASQLARALERDKFAASAIHSDRSQLERLETLSAFKENRIRILVATDIAARGLDIQELPLVVNYDLPPNPEDYIHRIGRTGRAGAAGAAVTLVSRDEERGLADIERLTKQKLERRDPDQLTASIEAAAVPGEFEEDTPIPSFIPRHFPAAPEVSTTSVLLGNKRDTDNTRTPWQGSEVRNSAAGRGQLAALLGGLKKLPTN